MSKTWTIHQGDARQILPKLESDSVDCCITSPPYWGLRDYKTGEWIGGGDPDCNHEQRHGQQGSTGDRADRSYAGQVPQKGTCVKCGARRVNDFQIGLEENPEDYVEIMVQVFREVRRIIKADGTLWLNLGDSYSTSNFRNGVKPKDLMGMPWRIAFALQRDGYYLRSDIIWNKPNPQPESVQDRPTKAHEYLFLFSRSERYFYDVAAIRERATAGHPPGNRSHKHVKASETDARLRSKAGLLDYSNRVSERTPAGWHQGTRAEGSAPRDQRGKNFTADPQSAGRRMVEAVAQARRNGAAHDNPFGEWRNKRSVWTMATMPTAEQHFATYPVELPEICMLAGSRPGGTVLDPFAGLGTTGLACLKTGRDFVGLELNARYIELGRQRASEIYPLLVGVP